MDSECLMVNCRNKAPDDEAMCAKHRDDPRIPQGYKPMLYAYCCNGDPAFCDCVNPSHGVALFHKGYRRES